jgi:fucose permease
MATFVMLGLPDGTLGVAWPSIRSSFGLPLAALGVLLGGITVSYLLSGAASGHLIARLGLKRVLIGSISMFVAALGLIAISPLWWFLPLGMVVLGFGAGTLDAALNAFAATHRAQRFLGLLHAAYSAGGALGPLLVVTAVSAGLSWRGAYGALSVVAFLMLVAVWFAGGWRIPGSPDSGQAPASADHRSSGGADRAEHWLGLLRSSRWPLLLLSLAAFFIYTGTEVAGGQWAFSFLTGGRHTDIRLAGAAVSAFWGTQTAVRAASGFIAVRLGSDRLIFISLAASLAGAAALWWADNAVAEVLALGLFGGGLGPLFPTLISLTPLRFGSQAVQVVGYQVASASIGGAVLAGLTGVALQQWGLLLLPALLFAGVATTMLLHYAALRLAPPQKATAPSPFA